MTKRKLSQNMARMLYPRFHNVPKVIKTGYFLWLTKKTYRDKCVFRTYEFGKLTFDKKNIIRAIRGFGAWGNAPFFLVCVGLLYFGSPCCK